MDLRGLTPDDCDLGEVFFAKNEVVEMVIVDHREDDKNNNLWIKCKIMSGDNIGKEYDVFFSGSDNEFCRKNKANLVFKSGIWAPADWQHGKVDLNKMRGHKIQGKASDITEKNGRKFQNIHNIRSLGLAQTAAQPVQQQQPANGVLNQLPPNEQPGQVQGQVQQEGVPAPTQQFAQY